MSPIRCLILLTVFCASLCVARSQAPTITWQRSFGGSAYDDGYSITHAPDGGYLIGGLTNSHDGDVEGVHSELGDYWAVRIDGEGHILWQRALGGRGYDHGYAVTTTADGNFIIAGQVSSKATDGDITARKGAASVPDFWIVKLDDKGDILWQSTMGGYVNDIAHAVAPTSDGGCIVAGISSSNDSDVIDHHPPTGKPDYWVVKLDADGKSQWARSYGGSQEDEAYAVIQTRNGDYMVGGWSFSKDGDLLSSNSGKDYWVLKLDPQGNIVWQKSYGGSGYDELFSIVETDDGNIVLAGSTNSPEPAGRHAPLYNEDMWLVKIDPQGTVLWDKIYGGSGRDWARNIIRARDGGLIVVGTADSANGDVTRNNGGLDYWVIKLTDGGNLQWQHGMGGPGTDVAYAATEGSDGGVVVVGTAYAPEGDITDHHGASDIWAVKLGGLLSDVPSAHHRPLLPHPNPFSLSLTIPLADPNVDPHAIDVSMYDYLGRAVPIPWRLDKANVVIVRNGLPSGLYLYEIRSSDGKTIRGTVIVQ